jgi:hypothetical protein
MLGQGYGYQPGAMGVDFEPYDDFYDRASYQYLWCLWPRRCYITGRRMWLKVAVRGRAVWHGPGDPAVEERWFDRDQALLMFMKRG